MGGRGASGNIRSRKIDFHESAKVPKMDGGKPNPYIGTEYDSDSNYYTFKLWEKGEKRRVYATDYKRRTVGYIDLNSKEVVTDYAKGPVVETLNYFLKNYRVKKKKRTEAP